jgi:hypothetical protein
MFTPIPVRRIGKTRRSAITPMRPNQSPYSLLAPAAITGSIGIARRLLQNHISCKREALMRVRSVLVKSAVVTCSLLLVSGYIYLRCGGELFSSSAPKTEPDKFLPGPKSTRVLAVRTPDVSGTAAASPTDGSANRKNPAVVRGTKMMMPGTKSAMILLLAPGESFPSEAGPASKTGGNGSTQGTESRSLP